MDDSGAVVQPRTGERDVGSQEGDWVWHPIASPKDTLEPR